MKLELDLRHCDMQQKALFTIDGLGILKFSEHRLRVTTHRIYVCLSEDLILCFTCPFDKADQMAGVPLQLGCVSAGPDELRSPARLSRLQNFEESRQPSTLFRTTRRHRFLLPPQSRAALRSVCHFIQTNLSLAQLPIYSHPEKDEL